MMCFIATLCEQLLTYVCLARLIHHVGVITRPFRNLFYAGITRWHCDPMPD